MPELKLIMKEVYIKSVANEAIDTYFQKKKIVLIIHYCRATSIINTTKLVSIMILKIGTALQGSETENNSRKKQLGTR